MEQQNFVVYKSSAGSGKTFTLVKEYLLLALKDASVPPQAYKHILAITFTNKAAGEMKERIIKALKELSSDDYFSISNNSKNTLEAIKEDAPFLNDEIIRARTKNILTAILHNYSDFAIGTIDSFVHKIVRTFAYDLKIPLNFEIETDSQKLLTQCIDVLISQIGNDDKLTKALIEFTESKTDDEKNWHVENDLKNFAAQLLKEEGTLHIERLKHLSIDDFFTIKSELAAKIKLFENKIITESTKAKDLIKQSNIDINDFYYGTTGIGVYFSNLSQGNIDKISPNSRVLTTINEDNWYAGKITNDKKSAIDSIKKELEILFYNIQKIKLKDYPEYVLFSLINKNIYSLALLNEIEKLINEYKTENSVIHISDFNKKIAEIVLTQPVPYIYERLGERYKNYLIDEFQDTSILQFQNLLPLIDNSLSESHFTMLVGDGKQAIYRWRGGDVEQFNSLPDINNHFKNSIIAERELALKRNYNPKVLFKNYRSKKEIIEFNNSFFRILSNCIDENQKSIYENLEQEFNPKNNGGFVHVEFVNAKNKVEAEEINLTKIIETINDLIANDYNYSDIAILVRKNDDGSTIANFLGKNNIPVISSESLLLNNSKEIKFILSLLQYFSKPNQPIIQAEIIEYLIETKFIKQANLNDALKENEEIGFVLFMKKHGVVMHSYHFSKMAIYELCESLISLFKLNEKPNAYIQFFLDEIHQFSNKYNNSLNDFIEHWNNRKEKASVIMPSGINAVNIMTIHRSKGLEFPIVILPFLNSKIESQNNKTLWLELKNNEIETLKTTIVPYEKKLLDTNYSDLYTNEKNKSLLDNLNLLYVALTRPVNQLYIFTGEQKEVINGIGTLTDFFIFYYQQKNEYDLSENIYRFGEKTKNTEKKSHFTESKTIHTFHSTNWREIVKMRAAAPSIWNTHFAENKRDYGVILHTALAKIKYKNDVDSALNAMVNEGLISMPDKQNLFEKLDKIVNHKKLVDYFSETYIIKNESEIITANGKIYRTDRVVIKNNEAIIIDYKTGEKKSAHKKQIEEYADLLKEMGYTITQKLLVYINEDEINIE